MLFHFIRQESDIIRQRSKSMGTLLWLNTIAVKRTCAWTSLFNPIKKEYILCM